MLVRNAEAENLVLITDPRVLAIRVVDNREPMVNLQDQQDIAFGPSPEIPNNQDYTLRRHHRLFLLPPRRIEQS